MSSRSLLSWVALVAGAELAVRGHLADRSLACHGGALLFAAALAALTWPGRGRRAGALAASALAALALLDAGWRIAGPAAAEQMLAERRAVLPSLGNILTHRFACPPGVAAFGLTELGSPSPWSEGEWSFVLLHGGETIVDAVLEEAPELRADAAPTGPRASPLAARLERSVRRSAAERRWRRAREALEQLEPERSRVFAAYRAAILGARRSGAGVALALAPVPGEAPAEPDQRTRWAARRAHEQLARAAAGRYGIPVIELSPDLGALRARLSEPDAACTGR